MLAQKWALLLICTVKNMLYNSESKAKCHSETFCNDIVIANSYLDLIRE